MPQYAGGGEFALFLHAYPREFAIQNQKNTYAQLELTDA